MSGNSGRGSSEKYGISSTSSEPGRRAGSRQSSVSARSSPAGVSHLVRIVSDVPSRGKEWDDVLGVSLTEDTLDHSLGLDEFVPW